MNRTVNYAKELKSMTVEELIAYMDSQSVGFENCFKGYNIYKGKLKALFNSFERFALSKGYYVVKYSRGYGSSNGITISDYDMYLLPVGVQKPRFRDNCNGIHITHQDTSHPVQTLKSQNGKDLYNTVIWFIENSL